MSENYGKLATLFYECVKTSADAVAEVAFYRLYAEEAGGPILEPMCGTGRILLPLLRAGFAIEGFDASEEMLQALRSKYVLQWSAGEAPVWCQFAQHFVAKKSYHLILIPFGSWGLIVDERERADALAAFYKGLVPGGTFLLEVDMVASEAAHADEVVGHEQVYLLPDGGELRVIVQSLYDSSRCLYRALSRYSVWQAEVCVAQEDELFTQHVFTPSQIEHELTSAGFCIVGRYADYAKRPAGDDESRIVYECVKE